MPERSPHMSVDPANPIAAVTHGNPYPYYDSLLEGPSLYFDEGIQLWVAAHASSVSQAFGNSSCRVRPAAEPVPAALEGRPAGDIFRYLVRMNDGAGHAQPKPVLREALASIATADVVTHTKRAAEHSLPTILAPEALTAWVYQTPVAVVAELLGFSADQRWAIAREVADFVACLSPLSSLEQIGNANAAAMQLQARVRDALHCAKHQSDTLISRVHRDAHIAGWTDTAGIVANLIGLLSQTYEATAGLIGNAIVMLTNQPELLAEVRTRIDGWQLLVHETSRYESPVQNTRRFVVGSTTLGGVELQNGDAILLVLAAANRDRRANPDPQRFMLERVTRCVFTFSRGPHACPGEAIAREIAATALSVLDHHLGTPDLAQLTWTWKPSANGRLPLFW